MHIFSGKKVKDLNASQIADSASIDAALSIGGYEGNDKHGDESHTTVHI